MTKRESTVLEGKSNDAEFQINMQKPYIATVVLEGVTDLIFHRWSNEDVAGKAEGAKGSKVRKTDNVEAYTYRCDDGTLAVPGMQLQACLVKTAKFHQDPRSPRKSMMDLTKAAIAVLTPLASLGKKEWDYVDQRRVVIHGNAVTRSRPAIKVGWRAEFDILVNLPEYFPPQFLNTLVQEAGRLTGLAEMRPTYGRFNVIGFSVHQD